MGNVHKIISFKNKYAELETIHRILKDFKF